MEVAIRTSRTNFQFPKMDVPSRSEINKNFLIRWRTADEAPGYSNLISAGKYAEKFGKKYRDKHFTKAMESGQDRITFKIRGLYEITFISR
jgi:hypothetical protein